MFVEILGRSIPAYGLIIALGVICANIPAFLYLKKERLDTNDFIILEAYCFLGAFLGAKLLFLIVSFDLIQWNRVTEPDYFNSLMQSGFVFYGGMLGGLLFVILAGRFHRINAKDYIERLIFLIPFIHAFGRIGCYRAGCCYGITYSGIGAVIYSPGTLAPHGVPLFPVQLIEAVLLVLISVLLMCLTIKGKRSLTVPLYFITYGAVRFVLEFYRGDDVRGNYLFFTTSQWISMALIILGSVILFRNEAKKKSL